MSNVPLAIGLPFLAGFTTTFGVLATWTRVISEKSFLCFVLGSSAGVLIWVSLIELYQESLHAFSSSNQSDWYAVICFFCGWLTVVILDMIIHRFCGGHGELEYEEQNVNVSDDIPLAHDPLSTTVTDDQLSRMSISAGFSVAIHNLPEGLAVFIATMDDSVVGIILATAVILHNLPIGIAIAVSIYHTHRSRWKAFFWTFCVGLPQPIGGLLGYFLSQEVFTDQNLGVLFGFVSGMMISVVINDLLPLSQKYDVSGRLSSKAVFCGLFLVAIILQLAGHSHAEDEHVDP